MDRALSRYAAFFGRSPDLVLEPDPGATPAVAVARFPPVAVGFLRRLFVAMHDRCVYITCGMSDAAMKVPAQEAATHAARVELIASCPGAYVGARDGQDMVSALLQMVAGMPFSGDMFFGPLQTLALGRPLGETAMSALLFALPERIDTRRLCACTSQARQILSVMPITDSERAFAEQHGTMRLVEQFELRRVPNQFDIHRPAVV